VAGLTAVPGIAMCVFLVAVLVGQGVGRASLWATLLGLPTGIVAASAGVWAVVVRPRGVLVPPELEVPEWVVDRPTEAAKVVAALLRRRAGTVGITTALQGAGGFGKTILARVVCADHQVRQRFAGGIYVLTIGRDVRGAAALAAKANDVIKLITGEDATFTDPELAGARLGALLDTGPRRLLVLDDVWEPMQLAPFVAGGRRCARLVTTRDPALLAGRGLAVRVDQMSPQQALTLLMSRLPQLEAGLLSDLLAVTGRWPLLLRLANKILVNAAQAGADVPAAGAQLLQRLRAGGPAVIDDLSGESGRDLDVGHPDERARAVRATIGASTSLLDPRDALRFAELGVFAEDETIPFPLIAQLWRATGGLDDLESSQVCARLSELALVSAAETGTGGVALHDVIRDFLRRDLGPNQLAELNGVLVDVIAAPLPDAEILDAAGPASVAWWAAGSHDRYSRDHLIEHLLEAGRRCEAEKVATDLRWVGRRLEESGPAAPAADLSLVGTPQAASMRSALTRAAHLLAPTDPARAVVDVLHSRLASDQDWAAQVLALRKICQWPRLVNRWPLPDLPGPALRRVLAAHSDVVRAVAIAPDGKWLVTGSADRTARIWDAATGQERATLTHPGEVHEVAVAPDGGWLATETGDGTIRIWDVVTWQTLVTLPGSSAPVTAIAITPDGSQLATATARHSQAVQIWDTGTWRNLATFAGIAGQTRAIAVAPDGHWVATGHGGGPLSIWDVPGGRLLTTIGGHGKSVQAAAVAPDGRWLATGSSDRTVRIWDTRTWKTRDILTGHLDAVNAVAVAPDGRWLATGSSDRTVRIWDTTTENEPIVLTGQRGRVAGIIVAPDGEWLAAVNASERTVRIWDTATGQERAVLTGDRSVAVAPDCSWLATINAIDQTLRIWDTATGQQRVAVAPGRSGSGSTRRLYGSSVMGVAPDGSWLATVNAIDQTLRIWDTVTGQQQMALAATFYGSRVMGGAPDGSWLATGHTSAGTVQIWDTTTWKERATFDNGRRTGVSAIAVAPDGSWIATADSRSAKIRIWDATSRQILATLSGRAREVRSMIMAPDGSWLASADNYTGGIQIWDTTTWKERVTLAARDGPVHIKEIASDGSWLATVSMNHGTIQIWDVATGLERAAVIGCSGASAVAVAPDGTWLASADSDRGTVRIWDTATWEQLAALTGHLGKVTAVAITSDANWLATGSDDRTVKVWDTATWEASALMRVEDAVLTCVWLGLRALAVGGRAGLYVFDFLPGTSLVTNILDQF
jgi:WD40 repeat protein